MDDRHVMRIIKAAERIADATEKIVATLQRMADNDPMDGIMKALDAEAKVTPQEQPGVVVGKVKAVPQDPQYGVDLPESERWRLGT